MVEKQPNSPEEQAQVILSLLFEDLNTETDQHSTSKTELSPAGVSQPLSKALKDKLPNSLRRLAAIPQPNQERVKPIPFIPVIITIGIMTEHISGLVKKGCEQRGVQPHIVHIARETTSAFTQTYTLKSGLYSDTVSTPLQEGLIKAQLLPLQSLFDTNSLTWNKLQLPNKSETRAVVISSSLSDENLQTNLALPKQTVICNLFDQKSYATQ